MAGLETQDGILLKDGRVVLPRNSPVLRELFENAHCALLAGHRSAPATLERMRQSVWAER